MGPLRSYYSACVEASKEEAAQKMMPCGAVWQNSVAQSMRRDLVLIEGEYPNNFRDPSASDLFPPDPDERRPLLSLALSGACDDEAISSADAACKIAHEIYVREHWLGCSRDDLRNPRPALETCMALEGWGRCGKTASTNFACVVASADEQAV